MNIIKVLKRSSQTPDPEDENLSLKKKYPKTIRNVIARVKKRATNHLFALAHIT